jgi:CHAT domain-containing protein/tetratricopeptide (TPR) repeat protein
MSVRDRVATYLEKISRPSVRSLICAAAALGAFACSREPSADLATQYAAEQRIEGDKPAVVALDVQPGVYLVTARERDIDLRLVLDAGDAHSEIEDYVPRHGLLAKVVRLDGAGKLRVELRNSEHRGKHGVADLRIARWRQVSPSPGERELGYTALGIAGEQTALANKESWTRAVDLLHEAIAHFTAAHDDRARAQAEYTLGHLEYLARNDFPPAVRAAQRASEVYAALDDEIGATRAATLRAAAEIEVASAMNAGAQGAEQRALYASADQMLARTARWFGDHKLAVDAEYAVNMRGIRAFYEGRYEEAGGLFEQAIKMSRANLDPAAELRSLANLAWIHNRTGSVAQAAAEYERLLPLIEKERQPMQYSIAIGNYGLCLIALGDFDRALALYAEALEFDTRFQNDAEHARHLSALGGLYFRTGDMRRALETLRSAIAIQERIGDTINRASALRVAGNAASALEQHDLALAYLRKSAEIDRNPHTSARTRVLIAGELRVLGDLRGAEAELTHAMQSTNPLAQANVLDERGRLRIAQKNYSAAIADLRAADRQFSALDLDYNRIETNATLSQALLASRDVAGASGAADTGVSIVRRLRVKSANPEWRAHFLSARYSPYEARIAADFAAGDGTPASWHAFRTAEEVRARSLADQLAVRSRRTTADPAGDALRTQLTSQQLRLETRLQKQDVDEKEVLELRRAIVETRARMDAHLVQREGVVAGESTLTDSLAQLQARVPADTAVLAYFVGDGASYAWLLTRSSLRHTKLAGRASLQRLTDSFVNARRLGTPMDASDREVARQLLADLFAGQTSKRVLIVPDGPLNGIPFAALPRPGATDLLVDHFVIGYAPSVSLALSARPDKSTKATRVAVVSDPVYAPDDRRLELAARESGGNLRGPRPASPHNLTRLPYSGLEARTVAGALGPGNTVQLAGFDASLERVLALAGDNLAVLHFATHAVARRDLPEQSALYLSEYTRDGELLDDTRLTASAITRSGLHADVVVLSGCATGDGSELRGEGVLGLTYGFLANGSRSVVAALWPIEDASTARFMNEFYRAYRESGNTAEALRAAQLRTRDSAKAAVWSSFVVRANDFP